MGSETTFLRPGVLQCVENRPTKSGEGGGGGEKVHCQKKSARFFCAIFCTKNVPNFSVHFLYKKVPKCSCTWIFPINTFKMAPPVHNRYKSYQFQLSACFWKRIPIPWTKPPDQIQFSTYMCRFKIFPKKKEDINLKGFMNCDVRKIRCTRKFRRTLLLKCLFFNFCRDSFVS